MRRLLLPIVIAALLPLVARAQDTTVKPLCPLFTAIEIEAGATSLIDTYLSPRVYKGASLALGVELMRVMPTQQYRWVWQQHVRLHVARTRMPASGNGLTDAMGLHYSFAMMRRSDLPLRGLRLYYGANISLTAGALYNYHGGNNPVSVKADLSPGLTGMALYDFKIARLPVTARYQVSLPVIGLFVQPCYSMSYYEASLGNYAHMLHLGTWATKFDMVNRLTADLRFGSWSLRVGYGNHIYTTYTAGTRYQQVSHHFILGFAGDLLRWSSRDSGRSVMRALYTLY